MQAHRESRHPQAKPYNPILYLGDSSLSSAAGYLAGLMSFFRFAYDYLPSDVPVNGEAEAPRRLYIISDYVSKLMPESVQRKVVDRVAAGAGLLMIGGWESFHGQNGHWEDTPVGNILPVEMCHEDDRVNCDQGALVRKLVDHPIVQGLPFDERPPMVGGFTRIAPKGSGTVVLEAQGFRARRDASRAGECGLDEFVFEPTEKYPLLVVGQHGKGRTAALATDLAPHWVGGLVDWGGGPRVTTAAPGSWEIEVGDCYAEFIRNLLKWTGRLDEKPGSMNAEAGRAAVPAGAR